MSDAKTTQNHDTIRKWAESRGGKPSAVSGTGHGGEPGILRLDFEDPDPKLDVITWGEFFDKFDGAGLSFLYQETTEDGKKSRFHKFLHSGSKH